MVNVDSYLRIYRWRGLNGNTLVNGKADPHETSVALIQLATLARQPSAINQAIPKPLYHVLREQVDEKAVICCDMSDPDKRCLYLSDLYDFLQLYKRFVRNGFELT